jgi:hypothetical protein
MAKISRRERRKWVPNNIQGLKKIGKNKNKKLKIRQEVRKEKLMPLWSPKNDDILQRLPNIQKPNY